MSDLLALICVAGGLLLLGSAKLLGASCAPAAPGLVDWWPGEGNADDFQGTNNGVFTNPQYGPGEVGQAFSFDGSGNNVRIPASPVMDVGSGPGMTVEAWIYSTTGNSGMPIVEWVPKTVGAFGTHFYVHQTGSGVLYANLYDTAGNSHIILTAPGVVQINVYQHVAVTYDKASGIACLFVNGALQTNAILGTFTPQTSPDLSIGYRPNTVPFGPIAYVGRIDEASLYSRALSSNEVQAIFLAGTAGKCISSAPFIYVQPVSQTAIAGSNVSFSVTASGAQPLIYQWIMDGTNLPGATNATLILTHVQSSDSGIYAVSVTNNLGSIVSSNAVLTVNPPPPCTPPPVGLVSWWPGEGNANDNEGANNGVFTGAAYGPGEVGQAFSFDGSGNNVRVPASGSMNVGAGPGMTIEAWIFSTNSSSGGPIVEWVPKAVGAFGTHFWANEGGPGILYANLYDTANTGHIIQSTNGAVAPSAYQHVAVTYDKASGIARLFVNGTQVTQSALGSFTPQTSPDLSIGYRPNTVPFGPIPFIGRIDEVSLYSRALSGSEIQAIYNAGGSGKCNVPAAPSIFLQPSNQTATIGQATMFQVQAGGTAPLNYQWSFNSAALPGATNASLVLTNVQMSQAGSYSVVVTNDYGSITSTNASLVVNFPPANVNLVSASGTAGQLVSVPVVLLANGNENGLGFSVNYPPSLLTNAGVTLGSGASGASLIVNPNQAGTVGIGVALPSGTTFAPGTQQVAVITFASAASPTNYSIPLTFGDQPIQRLLSDASANKLPVTFTPGQVSLVRSSFEADVAPRPNGDGDVNVADWVQVGRFVAGLDTPSPSEFQRADCAPRDTLGDGLLTVSDWVQAGRYAAGLDPITLAGGPTGPAGGQVVIRHKEGTNPSRWVGVQGPLLFDGQTGTAYVQLQAQGDENGVGFSISFDPTVVAYTGVGAGADTLNATMDVNANQATNGQLGIILELPTDTSFSPGARQLVKVTFQAVTTNSINSAIALTDTPVRRDVADTNALSVAATYSNGIVQVNPRPSLSIAQASQSLTLSWPLWATNYNLQQAGGTSPASTVWSNLVVTPVATTNGLNATLPLSSKVQFYRLQHQ